MIDDLEAKRPSTILKVFHNPYTAWIILALSLIITGLAWYISSNITENRKSDRFDFRVSEISTAIKDRMDVYEQVLRCGVGVFDMNPNVTRSEWHDFIKSIDINTNWPGIQGIGYSIPVLQSEKRTHIKSIQAEGFPDYTMRPETERDEYTAIIYLEPFDWRNKRAFGYDMWSNEMRRAAMTRARDSGVAATSGIITLVQETETDIQKGFLIYLPVYKTQKTPITLIEKRKGFSGWVYGAFRAGDLMKGIVGSQDAHYKFEIYDSMETTQNTLLFDSNPEHSIEINPGSKKSKTSNLTIQGRPWTVVVHQIDKLATHTINLPNVVLLLGLIVDFLLFYVIYSIYTLQNRAMVIAKEMTIKYETADRLKSTFLSNMSHEIRTPMNGIVGAIHMLEDELETPEQKQWLQLQEKCTNHLLNLVNSVIDLSKIESDTNELVKKPFNLNSAMQLTLDITQQEAFKKNVSIIIQDDNCDPHNHYLVLQDENRFRQILINLISNAIKYGEGSDVIVASSSTINDDNHIEVKISVSDSGSGIPEELKESLFDPFSRNINHQQIEGAGLGLSISAKLAHLLGGEIWFENNQDKGVTFSVRFVFDKGEKIQKDEPLDQNISNINTIASQQRKNILLAEDNTDSAILTKAILLKKGAIVVDVAKNGLEAIALNKKNTYDLILMDINMPEVSGEEALLKIRETETNVIIIALTANAMAGDEQKFLGLGFNHYISKPMSLKSVDKILSFIK